MSIRTVVIGLAMSAIFATEGVAQKTYDTGASDTEIKIGQTMPYSGPLSSYATIAKIQAAYFQMINESGGVNGRKINFLSLDDGYSPPKTVEQIRKLVEGEGVLLTFGTMGTATNTAIHKYMNQKKVPMLFVASGASKWNDPEHFPWTMGWPQSYKLEGYEMAKYAVSHVTNPKIAILWQNDDLGKDFVAGFREGLGPDADKLIIKELTYQSADPTIESQIVALQASGANVFFNVTVSKFAAQAIRRASELGWHPLHLLISNSSSIAGTLAIAGLDKSKDIISTLTYKDPGDSQWQNDSDVMKYREFLKKYYPQGDIADVFNAYGYSAAQIMIQVLKQCGDDLTRENVMRQASNLAGIQLPMILPGILIKTSPTDFSVLSNSRMARFDGARWVLIEDKKTN